MDVNFNIFKKKKCKLMSLRVLYNQFEDIFFDIIVSNDKVILDKYKQFLMRLIGDMKKQQ